MSEIFTWSHALQMAFGIAATTAIYFVGVCIGATVKWFKETFLDPPSDEDPSDPDTSVIPSPSPGNDPQAP